MMQVRTARQGFIIATFLSLFSAQVMASDTDEATHIGYVSECGQGQQIVEELSTLPNVQDQVSCAAVEQQTAVHANSAAGRGKFGELRIPAALLFMALWLIGFYLAKPAPASRKRGALN
jgi:hypothetical protein